MFLCSRHLTCVRRLRGLALEHFDIRHNTAIHPTPPAHGLRMRANSNFECGRFQTSSSDPPLFPGNSPSPECDGDGDECSPRGIGAKSAGIASGGGGGRGGGGGGRVGPEEDVVSSQPAGGGRGGAGGRAGGRGGDDQRSDRDRYYYGGGGGANSSEPHVAESPGLCAYALDQVRAPEAIQLKAPSMPRPDVDPLFSPSCIPLVYHSTPELFLLQS